MFKRKSGEGQNGLVVNTTAQDQLQGMDPHYLNMPWKMRLSRTVYVPSIDTVTPEWDEDFLRRVQGNIVGSDHSDAQAADEGLDLPIVEQTARDSAEVQELVTKLGDLVTPKTD